MNIQKYSVALLTSFERNKTTSAVSKEANVSQSEGSRFLSKLEVSSSNFISNVKSLFGNKPINMVIDDANLCKRYALNTEAVSQIKDQSTKTFANGITILIGGLTDSKYFLPISLEHWIAEFIMQKAYLKKVTLAIQMIEKVITLGLNIEHFVLDGLYFAEKFLNFLDSKKLKFVIKAKTTTSVIHNGQKIQLKDCRDLRLNSNQNCKKIQAEWCGKMWYFIAMRRTGKHGNKIVYLVANFYAKSKTYVKIYESRWPVEKLIRTCKQKLGLNGSQSQLAKNYLNHIKCVFFAYGILQLIMKKFKLRSAEEALTKVQALKWRYHFDEIVDQISLFTKFA